MLDLHLDLKSTGFMRLITVEPNSSHEVAANKEEGLKKLQNTYEFLRFWDWLVCCPGGLVEVKTMDAVCRIGLDLGNPCVYKSTAVRRPREAMKDKLLPSKDVSVPSSYSIC